MDERADRRLLVEIVLGGEGERVDPIQRAVGLAFNRGLESLRYGRLRRLLQQIPERSRLSHRLSPVPDTVLDVGRRSRFRQSEADVGRIRLDGAS